MQDELRLALAELDHTRLDDAGDGVPARSHVTTVDLVPVVDDRDVADHLAGFLGEDVKLLAQRPQGDLEVLEDWIGLALVVECPFLGARDGVQALVIHSPEAQRLVGLDEILAPVGEQDGLHELSGLAEVEQIAALGVVTHLQDPLFLVEPRVGNRPQRDVDERLLEGETS